MATRPAGQGHRVAVQPVGQPEPVGQLGQQPDPGVADQPLLGHHHLIAGLDRLHCTLLGWWIDLRQAESSQLRRACTYSAAQPS
jgi:hypothetical protein